MTETMTVDAPWEPPLAGTEAEHLAGMLDRLRATFRWKADGLSKEGLSYRLPSSQLCLGALLKHLAVCEDDIFSWKLHGRRPFTRSFIPEGMELDYWQFNVTDDETAEQLYRVWDDAVDRSRTVMSTLHAPGALDAAGHLAFDGEHLSKRRIVCDLIEEYGRHVGHADLLREAIDGRVGEDPPLGWRPSSA